MHLLISECSPGDNRIGDIFLRDMLRACPEVEFVHVSISQHDRSETKDNLQLVRIIEKQLQTPPTVGRNRALRLLNDVKYRRMERHNLRHVLEELSSALAGFRIDRIWSLLETPSIIRLTAPLAATLNCPLDVQVWDDVEHLAYRWKLSKRRTRCLASDFSSCLNKASRLATICEAAAERYRRETNGEVVILRHGVDPLRSDQQRDASNCFWIGFAGSLYAKSAWDCLLKALDLLDWKVGGKQVGLRVIGSHASFTTKKACNVEFLGYQESDTDVQECLQSSDAFYLPQPFEPDWNTVARYSFPAKASLFAAIGRPIIVHGPEYASLFSCDAAVHAGPHVKSTNPEEMAAAIRHLVEDRNYWKQCAEGAKALNRTHLGSAAFQSASRRFLLGSR